MRQEPYDTVNQTHHLKFNMVVKARGLASYKTRYNPPFCPIPSQEKGSCYISFIFLCVLPCRLFFVVFLF